MSSFKARLSYILLCLLICTISVNSTLAQQQRLSGRITDTKGKPLPFVTLGLQKKLLGVVSNENGEFDLFYPAEASTDTLLINAFGYEKKVVALQQLVSPVQLQLKEAALEIEEVQVFAMPPEHYIKMAVRNIVANYPAQPFETVGYYREILKENQQFVQSDEAVFKTYYPAYLDTIRNQDQLLLWRRADDLKELAFMNREHKKKKNRAENDTTKKKQGFSIDASTLSGPQAILQSSKLSSNSWHFLDTNKFRRYEFAFEKPSAYSGNSIMVISFKSKGKVDHLREKGLIYLDNRDFAIVKIENSGDFVIPVIVRPILFVAGLAVTNPIYARTIEFREAGGKWYPQNIQIDVKVDLTKRYLFNPNEHAKLEVQQLFTVSRLRVSDAKTIPHQKRYDYHKEIEEQIYNDEGISWAELNIIKK